MLVLFVSVFVLISNPALRLLFQFDSPPPEPRRIRRGESSEGVCVYGRMNQGGGNTQTVAPLDPNSIEKRYGVDGSQVQISPYQYSIGSHTVVDNQVVQNGNYSNSNYYHHPPQPPLTGNVQETPNTISSTSGTANVAQDYSGYTPYQTSSDTPQNYSNAGYSNYYSGYQQQQQQQNQNTD